MLRTIEPPRGGFNLIWSLYLYVSVVHRRVGMASTLVPAIAPDSVVSFEINPGTLLQFLDTRAEGGGHRLKCVEGSVTLVSPGRPHERAGRRLDHLILAACSELGIRYEALGSTTWRLPLGAGDTAYEADNACDVQSFGVDDEDHPPDLAIEVVVTHPERKALLAGAVLRIPEVWVLDVPRHRLTFYHLAARGKDKETYRARSSSRAFPFLRPDELLERLDDPAADVTAFHENCRAWARAVLAPRRRGGRPGA
jgi:Uma2 family endonuclease